MSKTFTQISEETIAELREVPGFEDLKVELLEGFLLDMSGTADKLAEKLLKKGEKS